MNHNSQTDRIKADLLAGRPVDAVTAFNAHCITRLSAIIKRLRDNGWPISTDQDKGNGLARYALPDNWQPAPQNDRHKKSPSSRTKA
jgi:hypothetical protein